MDKTNLERAKQYALQRLERELSPNLHYHGIMHTRDEVVPAAARLAGMEGIQGEELILLLTAAWFHDLGFVEQGLYHELISARIAVETLPGFGYTDMQVETIRWAIMATALPQSPSTLMEQILTDADLDILGREEFMTRNGDLRSELAFAGKVFSDAEWYKNQLSFIESHNYFTLSAHQTRDAGKSANIAKLNRILKELDAEV